MVRIVMPRVAFVRKSTSIFIVFIALVSVLTAGCGGEEESPVVLRLNLGGEPRSLDPALATDIQSLDVVGSLFIGLTQLNEVTAEIEPDLAKSWDISQDGTVYTFHLRDDVKWTDGTRVTANDVEYGILRTLAPETASEYAYVPAAIVQGADDYNSGKVIDPGIVGVKALDKDTLEISLAHAAGYFPSIASMWLMWPQPRSAIEAHGDKWTEAENIVSNGPYKLESWDHENSLVLVKNPDYYDAKNVQIDRIELAMVLKNSIEMAMYEAGDLDCTCGLGIPLADIDRVKQDPNLRNELFTAPRLSTTFFGFNVTKPPFDDPLVRKSFSAAIDRQALIDNVLKGDQRVATTFTAPGNFGAVDGLAEGIGHSFDPVRARRYLSDAGYSGGQSLPSVTLMVISGAASEKISQAIQVMWKEHLGVEINLANQEFRTYLDTLSRDAPQIWLLAWTPDYPDANSWMPLFTTDSGNNFGKHSNPRFDQLVADAARESDPEIRKGLYREAEVLLTEEDTAMIPIYYHTFVTLSKPYLTRSYESFGFKVFKHWKLEK